MIHQTVMVPPVELARQKPNPFDVLAGMDVHRMPTPDSVHAYMRERSEAYAAAVCGVRAQVREPEPPAKVSLRRWLAVTATGTSVPIAISLAGYDWMAWGSFLLWVSVSCLWLMVMDAKPYDCRAPDFVPGQWRTRRFQESLGVPDDVSHMVSLLKEKLPSAEFFVYELGKDRILCLRASGEECYPERWQTEAN